jgi:hypothetical protein
VLKLQASSYSRAQVDHRHTHITVPGCLGVGVRQPSAMTEVPACKDPHAYARDVEGGERLTKGPLISESEEMFDPSIQQPRFLQPKDSGRWYSRFSKKALFIGQVLLFGVVVVQFIMLYRSYALAAAALRLVDAGVLKRQNASSGSSSVASNVPDYYVTKPLLLPGKPILQLLLL